MGNSTYRHEYTLRQDTPLIHFQHDQAGACLRASEVKPQLDRFIHAFLSKQNTAVPNAWYAAQSKKDTIKALSYKMTISCDPAATTTEAPHEKLHFGNMGDRATYKKQITMENVKISFFSFAKGCISISAAQEMTLLKLIDYVLPAFFALTCFGTRATKGFGSFSVVSERRLDEAYLWQFVPVYYTITYATLPSGREVLNDIWVISGMMKSGFNFTFKKPGDYYKGRIFRYFTENKIGSDKAFIKQFVLRTGQDVSEKSEEKARYDRFVYSRAMLGLAQAYEFRAGPKTTRSGKVLVSPAQGNPVKRFASPVRYIPNGKTLLILPTEIPDLMYDAQFLLNKAVISTPKKDEFTLLAYLDWFCDEFNKRREFPDSLNAEVRNMIGRRLNMVCHSQQKGG